MSNHSTRRRAEAARARRQRTVLLGAAATVLAIVGAWLVASNTGEVRVATALSTRSIGHVHGIAADETNGMIYAGTHFGVYRIDKQGAASLVGAKRDYMGFTLVGPGRFLASGHPAEGSGDPANVGLIESTDEGRTWKTLSLAGKADFHALAAREGRIYGYNAGTLMMSRDGKSWDNVGTTSVGQLAIDPANLDAVMATTKAGLALSSDAGRTFKPLPGAPAVALVTWPTPDMVVGVTASGEVYISADHGTTWEKRGVAGAAEALTATPTSIVLATHDAVVESRDGGRTFNRIIAIEGS